MGDWRYYGKGERLGLLRQHLRREVQKLVAVTSAKDVAWLDARSIAEYIGENLQPT